MLAENILLAGLLYHFRLTNKQIKCPLKPLLKGALPFLKQSNFSSQFRTNTSIPIGIGTDFLKVTQYQSCSIYN